MTAKFESIYDINICPYFVADRDLNLHQTRRFWVALLQMVDVNGTKSLQPAVSMGVIQGSILAPFLF